MKANPNISIIICSWQAPASLDETLQSIYTQTEGASFEVVLVNNGFSSARVENLRLAFPQTIIVDEATPGLAHARRAGFRAARGEFFVCIDDDNLLGKDFLSALEALVLQNPGLGVISPVVVPIWEKRPPLWLQEFGVCCLSYMTIAPPPPTGPKIEQVWHNPDFSGWPWPPGGGMIIHRSVAENYLKEHSTKRLQLGRIRNSLGGSEDQDICLRFAQLKRDAAYSEKLLVFHKIPVSRTKMSYLLRLNFRMTQDWATLERLRLLEKHPFASSTLNWHRQRLIRLPVKWVCGRISTSRFTLEWIRHAGFLWGWLRDSFRLGADESVST